MAQPKTIGACLKALAQLRAELDAIDAQRKPVADAEEALRAHMLESFRKDELNAARGSGLAIAVVQTNVPTVEDWAAFLAFAKRKGNDDLLQHSVSTPAWRERLNDGKPVPGVATFTRTSLRVSKVAG